MELEGKLEVWSDGRIVWNREPWADEPRRGPTENENAHTC
jgi:hypothetical protein